MECDVVSKYPQQLIDEIRVTRAESLENDYGPEVAFLIIRYRAIEAQSRALSKEFRKIAENATTMAERAAQLGTATET